MSGEKAVLIISALDCWSMGDGKGGPALYKTITGYSERGWKVYFITGNRGQGTVESLQENVQENVQIIRFDAPRLKRAMRIRKVGFFAKSLWWVYFQIAAFIKARRLRAGGKIDVVYGYEIYGVPVAKLLSKLWRVPVVARFQGTSLGVGWVNRRLWRLRAWEHVVGLRMPVDLVIMTDDGTQGDRVLRSLGAKMKRVKFWMNGVDWEPFTALSDRTEVRRELNIDTKWTLLTVSRLVAWKRVDRAIRVLPDVLRSFPDTVLLVVGEGPERDRLERLAVDLRITDHVCFEGAVPHKDVAKYLAAADIFLSFYDWSNVGNPLLEAMMAGKCIVTLNNGDTGRLIKNRENGILLEYEELPRRGEVIKELLANEELRNRLGANARKFAQENFWTWEQRIDAEVTEVNGLIERVRKRYSDGP